jgi:hypothetical protein
MQRIKITLPFVTPRSPDPLPPEQTFNQHTQHQHNMKILNTIVTSTYSTHYHAHVERTYSVVRPFKITHRGAYRILKNEYPELITASLVVCSIECAQYAR